VVKEHTREHMKIAPLQRDEAQRRFEHFLGLLRQRCPAAAAVHQGAATG
jgi:hypothetical protein